MSRIIWRRRGAEWVGRLTKDGPDRFRIDKAIMFGRNGWKLTDLQGKYVGLYTLLRHAKGCAEEMKTRRPTP